MKTFDLQSTLPWTIETTKTGHVHIKDKDNRWVAKLHNRTAKNYDPSATDDNGTCISSDDIFKKISIISGGDCKNCSGVVSIKIGDEYPVLYGSQGINVLVLERDQKLTIRHNRAFATGNYESESKKFVDFMREFVFYNDIVILAVRGDAVGKKRQENERFNI